MSADRMADCTQKLLATIGLSAAIESRQTGFNSLIVQHVRFFLGLTICLIWCRVVQSRMRLKIFIAKCETLVDKNVIILCIL